MGSRRRTSPRPSRAGRALKIEQTRVSSGEGAPSSLVANVHFAVQRRRDAGHGGSQHHRRQHRHHQTRDPEGRVLLGPDAIRSCAPPRRHLLRLLILVCL